MGRLTKPQYLQMVKRDNKIYADYKSGLSYSDISKVTGLTRQRIFQIVDKRERPNKANS